MNLWESLLDILGEQVDCYAKLNSLMESKQRIIVEDKLKELEEVVAKEGAFIKYITNLENARMEVVTKLRAELALPEENLSLSQLEKFLPESYCSKYEKLKQQMQNNLEKAQVLNRQNQELLDSSLNYINFSLSLLTGLHNTPVYGQLGREQDKQQIRKSNFDHKV